MQKKKQKQVPRAFKSADRAFLLVSIQKRPLPESMFFERDFRLCGELDFEIARIVKHGASKVRGRVSVQRCLHEHRALMSPGKIPGGTWL